MHNQIPDHDFHYPVSLNNRHRVMNRQLRLNGAPHAHNSHRPRLMFQQSLDQRSSQNYSKSHDVLPHSGSVPDLELYVRTRRSWHETTGYERHYDNAHMPDNYKTYSSSSYETDDDDDPDSPPMGSQTMLSTRENHFDSRRRSGRSLNESNLNPREVGHYRREDPIPTRISLSSRNVSAPRGPSHASGGVSHMTKTIRMDSLNSSGRFDRDLSPPPANPEDSINSNGFTKAPKMKHHSHSKTSARPPTPPPLPTKLISGASKMKHRKHSKTSARPPTPPPMPTKPISGASKMKHRKHNKTSARPPTPPPMPTKPNSDNTKQKPWILRKKKTSGLVPNELREREANISASMLQSVTLKKTKNKYTLAATSAESAEEEERSNGTDQESDGISFEEEVVEKVIESELERQVDEETDSGIVRRKLGIKQAKSDLSTSVSDHNIEKNVSFANSPDMSEYRQSTRSVKKKKKVSIGVSVTTNTKTNIEETVALRNKLEQNSKKQKTVTKNTQKSTAKINEEVECDTDDGMMKQNGHTMPDWKRQLLARKAAQKRTEEELAHQSAENFRKMKLLKTPPWKRHIHQRENRETQE